MNLNSYDITGGVLLVEEAGWELCDFGGLDHYPDEGIVATNGLRSGALLKLLQNVCKPVNKLQRT